uniref:NB-ARC domain-containing protein n=1 Tax=Oryza meridionalis TaxID=40149 RepID=A0A0E0FBV1_9ORYZ
MDLLNIGKEIIRKLKCSPLAAKTVGRLLRKDLTQEHWRRVLYNEEWGYQTGDNDIMPALKISFDYLPFHLKKCFSYCALFPEDHLFGSHQLIHLWLALGILHNRDKNMRIQEMGLYYINELVNNGFFQKYNETETQLDYPLLFQKETTYPCYVMHDLFHELARNISSYECISVDYSSSRPMYFPQSIRHLSIVTRQEKDTEAECNDNFKEQMYKLKERIDIGNLRTLMLFGEYNTTFATIFQETFKEINGLRVLSLYAASQDFLPHNFSKLIHLRYLRIQSHSDDSILLPNTLSRFCHLKVLDLEQWEGNSSLPTDMSRLRNLCFFHAGKELHFNIPNVGKLMFLQELKKFHVKKESTGFGLQELAGLKELGGSLTLQNLENVKTKREADEAKLMLKKNITELKLIWDSNRPQKEPAIEADILESLQPHPNIKHLCIKNNGSRDCPTWLRSNICIQMLQSLHLQGISWTRLPPFGQIPHLKKLKLENIACMDQFGEAEFSHLSNQSFRNLKVIVFHSMPEFKKWSSGDYCNLFNGLEALEISKCPKLNELPFTTSLDSTTQDSQSMFWFQNLHKLVIDDCPQLLPLAPLPHTAALEHVQFRTDDSDVLYTNGGLTVSGETRSWEVRSSAQQQKVHYHEYCPMSVKDLQKLIPLKILRVVHCGKVLIKEMVVGFTSISVECLDLTKCCISGKELSVMLNYLPNVSHLFIDQCPNITRMSSKQSEDDKAEDDEGLLQLLPKLSKLLSNISIEYCENLTLCAHHGGIQEFVPLQSLTMSVCEVLFPCWPIDGDIFNPFPSTLKQLYLRQISSMESMAPLSSLTSLTHLEIVDCENVKMDGFDPLILQNLKKLVVYNRDDQYSIAANIMSRATNMILEKTRLMLTNTFKLEELVVDSISAVLLAPLCIHLSDSLHMLSLSYDHGRRQIESFTQEQEQAFLKLTSLRQLHFVSCKGIHSLPVGLQCLPSLEMLKLQHCTRLQELTIENLPSSLQQLVVYDYRRTMKEQLKRLREKFPELVIEYRETPPTPKFQLIQFGTRAMAANGGWIQGYLAKWRSDGTAA